MEASLDIFWHVVSSCSILLRDEGFDDIQILREIDCTILVGTISKVPVANKGDSDLECWVVSLNLVDDGLKSVL